MHIARWFFMCSLLRGSCGGHAAAASKLTHQSTAHCYAYHARVRSHTLHNASQLPQRRRLCCSKHCCYADAVLLPEMLQWVCMIMGAPALSMSRALSPSWQQGPCKHSTVEHCSIKKCVHGCWCCLWQLLCTQASDVPELL